jgi:hypothetical protein
MYEISSYHGLQINYVTCKAVSYEPTQPNNFFERYYEDQN